MSLPVPRLDDTDFERLVEEARARIPRYAPEWTDHNLHDPGITLLELLAWIVDQQIFQVGFVGDRHLEAFAALLGVRRQAPVPARGLLWPRAAAVGTAVDLECGAPVTCVQQPEVSFELEADVHLTPARLLEATAGVEGGAVSLLSFFADAASSFALRVGETATGAGLDLLLDRPLVGPTDTPAPHPVALGIEVAPPPCARSDSATPWGPLLFEYRTESSGSWRRLEVVHDGTVALARTGVVFLRVPPAAGEGPARLRLRLDRGLFPIAPRLVRVALNVLPIVQLETRPEAVLGRSDGLPDQRFKLDLAGLPSGGGEGAAARRPVPQAPPYSAADPWALETPRKPLAPRERGLDAAGYQPLRVEVQEVREFRQWQKVEHLTACGPADRAYEIDTQTGDIRFGNGVNGRVPWKDAQILCRSYHLTGGSQGNLRAGLGWRVVGAPTGNGVYGSNPVPLWGGADAWDMDRLRQRAREIVLQRNVLLRDCDLQQAALGLPGYGVARAEVVPRFHPAFPQADMPHARTLVVIPWRGPDEGAAPAVGEVYADAVAAALSPRRVLGERLTVMAAPRVPVRVRAELLAEEGVDAQRLRAEASHRLDARLSDMAVDDQVAPWPVGRPVTVGEIKTLLAGIDRVIAVPTCELACGEGGFAEEPIPLLRYEVAIGGRHEIEVRTFATE